MNLPKGNFFGLFGATVHQIDTVGDRYALVGTVGAGDYFLTCLATQSTRWTQLGTGVLWWDQLGQETLSNLFSYTVHQMDTVGDRYALVGPVGAEDDLDAGGRPSPTSHNLPTAFLDINFDAKIHAAREAFNLIVHKNRMLHYQIGQNSGIKIKNFKSKGLTYV